MQLNADKEYKYVVNENDHENMDIFIGYKESKKENKFDFVKPKNIVFISLDSDVKST